MLSEACSKGSSRDLLFELAIYSGRHRKAIPQINQKLSLPVQKFS